MAPFFLDHPVYATGCMELPSFAHDKIILLMSDYEQTYMRRCMGKEHAWLPSAPPCMQFLWLEPRHVGYNDSLTCSVIF